MTNPMRRITTSLRARALIVAICCLGGRSNVPALAAERSAPVLKLAPLAAPPDTTEKALLAPDHPLWSRAPRTPLRLSRTPPLYAGGPRDDGHRPSATAQLVRLAGGEVVVRLHWSDSTEDLGGKTRRIADVGEPKIYKPHPVTVSGFADGAAVMVPRRRGPHVTYPSLVMGHAGAPTDLYFWRAGLGFQRLAAAGRGTTRATPSPVRGVAHRRSDGWVVTLSVGPLPRHTPVSFAIFDGHRSHRDGVKYFTVWHEAW